MNFNTRAVIASLSLAGMLSGCTTVAPKQLVEARDAYATSTTGKAGQLTPTELYDAKKVLDKANAEFEANGDTWQVRDYAYIAYRKVQVADTKARAQEDRQKIAEAVKLGVVVRDEKLKQTTESLKATRDQLNSERRDNTAVTTELRNQNLAKDTELDNKGKELANKSQELEKSAAQVEIERQARLAAEAKLEAAMKDLAKIAAVKEEARGMVITLSGSVLFPSGKYTLLDTAKNRLDQVAQALVAQPDNKRMVVEGHTDNQGSDAINQPLSLSRAAAVRDYLVLKGVDANKITAIGMGSSHPLVDNTSAENRANNRRVEIVIGATRVTER